MLIHAFLFRATVEFPVVSRNPLVGALGATTAPQGARADDITRNGATKVRDPPGALNPAVEIRRTDRLTKTRVGRQSPRLARADSLRMLIYAFLFRATVEFPVVSQGLVAQGRRLLRAIPASVGLRHPRVTHRYHRCRTCSAGSCNDCSRDRTRLKGRCTRLADILPFLFLRHTHTHTSTARLHLCLSVAETVDSWVCVSGAGCKLLGARASIIPA